MTEAPPWFDHGLAHPGTSGDTIVDGARIHYETWGEAGAPGVVLIHGSNAHLQWWRFVAPYLARKYRVAALDLSGNGDSDHRDHYSGEQLAAEVWAVCEAAQLGERPFVVGHSFGGFVALQTAHYHGDRLGGVIFNDFTVRPPEDYVEWGLRAEREGRTEPRRLRVYDDLETAVGRFRLMPEQPIRHPGVHRWLAEQSLKQVDGGWTWKFDPNLFEHLEMGRDQRDRFAGLACRSGVILGEHSADDGARSGPYMREITNGILPILTIPHTHHHMMFEEPLALTMAIEGLVDAWIEADRHEEMQATLAALPDSTTARSATG
jgi:pimeloyl-ACP methyl ester carboxylesterase